MSHTPGPWKNDNGIIRVAERPALCVAGMIYSPDDPEDVTYEQSRANARLIAAAPDLLEALALMEHQISAICPRASTLSYARAALAMARGQDTQRR